MPRRHTKTIFALSIITVLCVAALVPYAVDRLVQRIGGASNYAPEDAEWLLSESAQALVTKAYKGLAKNSPVIDHHVHAISLGQRDGPEFSNRSYVNPEMLSWRFPRTHLRGLVYLNAAGISDELRADDLYLSRLLRLVRSLPKKQRLKLVAVDQRYNREGEAQPEQTPFYVDNEYVWHLSQQHPDTLSAVISVHPYRKDAIETLEKWAKRGVKTVKWLPNLQDIDPADERLEVYYQTLIDNNLTLLTHTGDDQGLSGGNPEYGNPLRYRRALQQGVRIIMAHCASTGMFPDPDDSEAEPRPGYEWFLQLLKDEAYAKNLYGDISGLTHRNRDPASLTKILQSPQIFDHLLYGSDYPLPAINAVVDLKMLEEAGFIKAEQVPDLQEIYNVNPLLFDFVLKRSVRLPQTDLGLPDAVFTREIDRKK